MFEKYVGKTKKATPHVTVSKGKRIHVSRSLLEQIGSPEAVCLLHDKETGEIALQAAKKSDEGAHMVQGYNAKVKSQMLHVYAKMFLDHISFGTDLARFTKVRTEDGMVIFGKA